MSLRPALRSLRLGRLAYLAWHAPLGRIRRSINAGGPVHELKNFLGERAMRRAAATLPTSHAPADPTLPELHFLTGRRFWHQTAFCLHSLQAHSGVTFRAVFHDDGSIGPDIAAHLTGLFPAATIRCRADNDARLTALLPPAHFPFLHDRRKFYPNILKLTDAHAGARGWRLVLDSDMIFFRRPDFLLDWLAAPDRPFHMVDFADSYGYPLDFMAELAGAPIPHLVNVGFTGLQSDTLDWAKLEHWCAQLIGRHGTSYYLEQALIAMLVAGRPCAIAPKADYLLMPGVAECRAPRAALHHYVAESKRGYFRHAWRHVPGAILP